MRRVWFDRSCLSYLEAKIFEHHFISDLNTAPRKSEGLYKRFKH